MPEEGLDWLPNDAILTIDEIARLTRVFVGLGIEEVRLTGGEPTLRRDLPEIISRLAPLGASGLRSLSLTTNGILLPRLAPALAEAGLTRINVSLDTLDAAKFRAITRWGDLDRVMSGLKAAQRAGLSIKINAVALKGVNESEIHSLVRWSHDEGMDITFIEVMPMGDIEPDRYDQYWPLTEVKKHLADAFTLTDIDDQTGGPARYSRVKETGGRIGFITPLTHNFCESCNRVRLTCTGMLYMCLGQDDSADLRAPLRASSSNDLVARMIDNAILRKPKGHDFIIDRVGARPAITRHMSVTGG